MYSATYQNHNQRLAVSLKSQNQNAPHRRDNIHHQAIFAAVREWESTIPGQAQQKIALLVEEQWHEQGGRGITVNKQNLFRYLKNEHCSSKYTSYVMQLASAISAAMPIEIARRHGLRSGKTEAELVASAVKECSEAHQAKLIGAPPSKLEKEIREAAISLFNMLPADAAGPLLASISAVAPQCI
ncbi:toxin YdaT family protein [Atlantibacter hermannii]|uniref:toxin YdaT family protein n=1 Tax=Atlantibacter hermannii TaxID=565 RepID=UPI0028AD8CBC|nr:toxin YdaT family protein [Atlantibacter hermannii]